MSSPHDDDAKRPVSSVAPEYDEKSPELSDSKAAESLSSATASITAADDSAPTSATPKKSLSELDLNGTQAGVGIVAGLPDQDTHPSDLEKGATQLHVELDLNKEAENEEYRARLRRDPNLVTWDGPDDPENPKNWSMRKKWIVTWTVSLFTLMSPVSSSMLAPALPEIAYELHMPPEGVLTSMTLSIFVLAYAIGPLFLGPLSELAGRQIILQCSNIFFLIFNIACSQAKTRTQMLLFRFFAGLGGSAPLAVGGGALSDMWIPEQRGVATAIYSVMPLTGPALGPIAGGWIVERTSWRWIFYSSSICDGVVQLMGFLYLKETYAPKILGDKAKRLRKETGNDKLHTEYDHPDRTYRSVVVQGLSRPLLFLATEPIVQVFSAYQAALYGLMYLTLTTFSELFAKTYHMSVGVGSLNFLALGIGFYLGAMLGARTLDRTYQALKKRNGGVGTPEMRMPLMIGTSILVPVGLLWYGWSADKAVHWIVPDIGAAVFSIGVIGAFLAISTYLIDNFHIHSASALAAAAAFRSLAGFGFPLFADNMFSVLGIGWGNTLCAGIAVLFLPAPWFFYYYGPWLRSKSRFAKQNAAAARVSQALRN